MPKAPQYEPFEDPEKLKRLYHQAGLSQRQIASKFGVGRKKVRNAMNRYGIETREPGGDYSKYVPLRTDKQGYERWQSTNEYVRVHQLLMISEAISPHEIFSDENVVHHKNRVPWDNRIENLELMTRSGHSKHHYEQGDAGLLTDSNPWYSDDELLEWIEAFVSEFGVVPSTTDAKNWPGPSAETYRERFGCWSNALEEAGYESRGNQ